ncbi:MAG: PIN domain-containing protein [Limisphaerales bacterium]
MRADYRVFLDSCVIANQGVCDLLLRLSERPRLIVPHWSAQVLAEVRNTHVEKLRWPQHLADSFQAAVREAFPEAEISGYESIVPSLSNDAKDRHVLAAAICGGCHLILTFNLKHFPPKPLAQWTVHASHPQDYLLVLYEMEPKQIVGCLGEIAGRRKLEIEDILIRLGAVLPCFSSRLLDDLGR